MSQTGFQDLFVAGQGLIAGTIESDLTESLDLVYLLLSLIMFGDRRITLETNGKYFPRAPQPHNLAMAFDGTILINTDSHVWHFSRSGSLIREFGRQGQGPNEFEFIEGVAWTGRAYFVSDGGTLSVTELNTDGGFTKRHHVFLKRMIGYKNRVFGVDYDFTSRPMTMFDEGKNVVRELGPDGNLGEPFFQVLENAAKVDLIFSSFFIWSDSSGDLFVCHEMMPEVFVFEGLSKAPLRSFPLAIPGFEIFDHKIPNRNEISQSEWIQWVWEVNRIVRIVNSDAGYFVQYVRGGEPGSFDPHKYFSWTQKRLCRLNKNGRPLGRCENIDGWLIGAWPNELVFMVESAVDDSPGFELLVRYMD